MENNWELRTCFEGGFEKISRSWRAWCKQFGQENLDPGELYMNYFNPLPPFNFLLPICFFGGLRHSISQLETLYSGSLHPGVHMLKAK